MYREICFIFIAILAPQFGSLKFRGGGGRVSCIRQSSWQLWYVAPLHETRRTAKKVSYVRKVGKAG